MTRVSVQNIIKLFGAFRALQGVNIDVADGEVVALLGPSGCGKTTTLRSIAGLETPTSGAIQISGQSVFADGKILVPTERRGIGMVFQSYALWPHMTVFDNVAYGLHFNNVEAGKISGRVHEALSIVGMTDLAQRLPAELSGGQQQRVAVARALAPSPSILLFDEPLSNLDQKLRERMRLELRALQKQLGYSGVYVTHDRVEAMVTADRILVMNKGRVVEEGNPQDLYNHPRHLFTANFLGDLNRFGGKVVGTSEDGLLELETDIGKLRAVANMAAFAKGQSVIVGVRPEALHVETGSLASSELLRATVEDSVFLGERIQIEVAIGGRTLKCLAADGTPRLAHGTPVSLSVRPERVLVFDTQEQSELPEEDIQ